MKKTKILAPALLSIAACGAIAAGSTYALFTSEAKTNVAITSGKVSVVATLGDLVTYSGVDLTGDPSTDVLQETAVPGTFSNGGTAVLEGDTLTLSKLTPGDKAKFSLKIENKSNVAIKYRTIVSSEDTSDVVEEGKSLANALKCNIGGLVVDGVSEWKKLEYAEGSENGASYDDCYVELPSSVGNAYLNKSCKITFAVEAIQANAHTENEYGVSISSASNGYIKADKKMAKAGEEVTFTIAPDAGYAFNSLTMNGTVVKFDDDAYADVLKPVDPTNSTALTFKTAMVEGGLIVDSISFMDGFEANTTNIQDILDGEYGCIDGLKIYLTEGEYGTLHFRQSISSELFASKAAEESHNYGPNRDVAVDSGYMVFAGSDHLTHVDATYMRTLKDVTIVGSSGAKVDNIEFMDGTYAYAEDTASSVSGNTIYQQYDETVEGATVGAYFLRSYFTIENLTVKDVAFSGKKTALQLTLHGSDVFAAGHDRFVVDGLRLEGCTIDGNGVKNENDGSADRMLLSLCKTATTGMGENDDPFKNVSVENCAVSNLERGMRLDGIENFEARGNSFNAITWQSILLAQEISYRAVTGDIVIDKNTADGIKERFVRIGASASAINLVLTNNSVTNYLGGDDDYIKIQGTLSGKKVENNTVVAGDSSRTITVTIPDVAA